MKAASAITVVALVMGGVVGCTDGRTNGTTTTTAPVPTTTALLTTTTTTTLEETTTTTAAASVRFQLESDRLYSTGQVVLQGMVYGTPGPVTATLDGSPVDLGSYADTANAIVTYWSDLTLEVGSHVVALTAPDVTGAAATATVSIVVDPDLETRFGYLECIDVQQFRVLASYADWLTGSEAVDAAREDGFIGEGEDLPNDYYIRQTSEALHPFDLDRDGLVLLQACYEDGPCVIRQRVDLETWRRLVAEPEAGYEITGWWWYGHGALPYVLTIRDGVVLQVEEWYLP